MATSLSADDITLNAPLHEIGNITLDAGVEINAFDPVSQRLFVVFGESGLQVVD